MTINYRKVPTSSEKVGTSISNGLIPLYVENRLSGMSVADSINSAEELQTNRKSLPKKSGGTIGSQRGENRNAHRHYVVEPFELEDK